MASSSAAPARSSSSLNNAFHDMASDSSSQPMETPTRAGHGQIERAKQMSCLMNRNLRKSHQSVPMHAVSDTPTTMHALRALALALTAACASGQSLWAWQHRGDVRAVVTVPPALVGAPLQVEVSVCVHHGSPAEAVLLYSVCAVLHIIPWRLSQSVCTSMPCIEQCSPAC
jgi:hypothetical protein